MLRDFVISRGLNILPKASVDLQKTLDSAFSLSNNLVRSFGQLRDIAEEDGVFVFRAVELLDLNPHAQSDNTHFPRVISLFDVPSDYYEFFMLDCSMSLHNKIPHSKEIDVRIRKSCQNVVTSLRPRHTLSVSLSQGKGLVYFEPRVTGGETLADVNMLYDLAKAFRNDLRS